MSPTTSGPRRSAPGRGDQPDYETTLTYLAAVRYSLHDFAGALDYATRVYPTTPGNSRPWRRSATPSSNSGATTTGRRLTRNWRQGPRPGRWAAWRTSPGSGSPGRRAAPDAAGGGRGGAVGLKGESAAWYHFQLGELLFNTGHPTTRPPQYTAAGNLFENYYLAYAGLGKVRAAQGRYDEAITLYERAVAIIPQPDFLAALGDVYLLAGRPADAQSAVRHGRIHRPARGDQPGHLQPPARPLPRQPRPPDPRGARSGGPRICGPQGCLRGRCARLGAIQGRAVQRGRRDRASGARPRHAGRAALLPRRDDRGPPGDRAGALQLPGDALALNPHFDPLQAPIARQTLDQLRGQ